MNIIMLEEHLAHRLIHQIEKHGFKREVKKEEVLSEGSGNENIEEEEIEEGSLNIVLKQGIAEVVQPKVKESETMQSSEGLAPSKSKRMIKNYFKKS